jgi:hypothetical protein
MRRRIRWWARALVVAVGLGSVTVAAAPARAAAQITQIGSLAGQTTSNEFHVSAAVSDDGNVVVFRSSDPALVAALGTATARRSCSSGAGASPASSRCR